MVIARAQPAGRGAALILSVLGHVALFSLVLMLTPGSMTSRPVEAIAVDLLTTQQFEALRQVRAVPPPTELAPPAEPPRTSDGTGTVVADRFYSASVLAEPGMEGIRRTLSTLAGSERVNQLCTVEAIEQIARHLPRFAPDSVVSYAMADPVVAGFRLTAHGGAFRSRRRWYALDYDCTVSPDYRGVSAFAFHVGEPIPKALWESHDLLVEDDGG